MIGSDTNINGVGDTGAVVVALASFFNWLPSLAALLSVIWLMLRIAESPTVQQMLGKHAWINRKVKTDEDDNEH